MKVEEILNSYGELLGSNAKCMGFLHGIAENFASKNDIKSKVFAKEIFEFLIKENSETKIAFGKSFQKEILEKYMEELIELNKSIALGMIDELHTKMIVKNN